MIDQASGEFYRVRKVDLELRLSEIAVYWRDAVDRNDDATAGYYEGLADELAANSSQHKPSFDELGSS